MADNPSVDSEAMGDCSSSGISPRDSSEHGGNLPREPGCREKEARAIAADASMGFSCAHPAALAVLRPGETVLVLDTGTGFDVFLAARKVGASGLSIGVHATPEMLARAHHSAEVYRNQSGLDNVEFRLGKTEYLPVADAAIDTVICNSIMNLSSNKPQVWREMARVLKPGGRVIVTDTALLKPLPEGALKLLNAFVGCVAGAVLAAEDECMAREAGFCQIVLKMKPRYIELMTNWEDPLYQEIMRHLPPGALPGDYITSLEIQARKPEV